jgi:hemerythrin-like domain-containing protein
MEILDHLEQEHRQAEHLMKELSETDSGPQRRETLDRLTEALAVHMQVEERFLYPIVADVMGDETEQEADVEHSLAREGLATLNDLVDEPGFKAALDMLQAGVRHHVEEEEQKIFPRLRSEARDQLAGLDPEELEDEVEQDDAGGGTGDRGRELTRDELYRQAQAADIPGRSNMTKDELADALAEKG